MAQVPVSASTGRLLRASDADARELTLELTDLSPEEAKKHGDVVLRARHACDCYRDEAYLAMNHLEVKINDDHFQIFAGDIDVSDFIEDTQAQADRIILGKATGYLLAVVIYLCLAIFMYARMAQDSSFDYICQIPTRELLLNQFQPNVTEALLATRWHVPVSTVICKPFRSSQELGANEIIDNGSSAQYFFTLILLLQIECVTILLLSKFPHSVDLDGRKEFYETVIAPTRKEVFQAWSFGVSALLLVLPTYFFVQACPLEYGEHCVFRDLSISKINGVKVYFLITLAISVVAYLYYARQLDNNASATDKSWKWLNILVMLFVFGLAALLYILVDNILRHGAAYGSLEALLFDMNSTKASFISDILAAVCISAPFYTLSLTIPFSTFSATRLRFKDVPERYELDVISAFNVFISDKDFGHTVEECEIMWKAVLLKFSGKDGETVQVGDQLLMRQSSKLAVQ